MKKLLCLVLTTVMIAMSLIACGKKAETEDKPRQIIARLIISSDVQVGDADGMGEIMLRRMFAEAYDYAETQEYKKVDAFIFTGDLSYSGSETEFGIFMKTVQSRLHEESKLITSYANNDLTGALDSDNLNDLLATENNIHEVVNGIHVIGISPKALSPDSYTESLPWLKETIADAVEESTGMPIITFQHHPLNGTLFVGDIGTNQLYDIYSQNPSIINFSGHTHYPVNDPRSIWQGDFTALGVGSLGTSINLPEYIDSGIQKTRLGETHTFTIVEIYNDGITVIHPYCVESNSFFDDTTTRTTDGVLEYTIAFPGQTSAFEYTQRDSEPPAFSEDETIVVERMTSGMTTIAFPQAKDDSGVIYYDITITDAQSGNTISAGSLRSLYYLNPVPEILVKTMSGMTEGGVYDISVVARDAYGGASTPLTLEYTFTEN